MVYKWGDPNHVSKSWDDPLCRDPPFQNKKIARKSWKMMGKKWWQPSPFIFQGEKSQKPMRFS